MSEYILQHSDGYVLRVRCSDDHWVQLGADGVFTITAPRYSLSDTGPEGVIVYQQPDIYSFSRADVDVTEVPL